MFVCCSGTTNNVADSDKKYVNLIVASDQEPDSDPFLNVRIRPKKVRIRNSEKYVNFMSPGSGTRSGRVSESVPKRPDPDSTKKVLYQTGSAKLTKNMSLLLASVPELDPFPRSRSYRSESEPLTIMQFLLNRQKFHFRLQLWHS
jgi:hypothetical protein